MKKAFTIVELLVVMAVIGILISLAVVGIQALQRSQRETTRLNDVRNIDAQLADYYTRFRVYPHSDNDPLMSEIKADSTNPNIGVCLLKPGTADGNECDIDSSNPVYATVIKTSYVITFLNEDFNYDTFDCGGGTYGTAENFSVLYMHRNVSSPQQYALVGCLESGKTINFGSLTSTP